MWQLSMTLIQVGVWRRGQNIEFVWLDMEHKPQKFCTTIEMLAEAKNKILICLASKQKIHLSFITAISPHQIWTKSILLPQQLNEQECEQQCQFLLEQELSIPISNLWFDYYADMVQQGFQLTLFAVQKSIAQQYLTELSVLNIDVLDNLAHTILRAFQFLMPTVQSINTLFLYQDEQSCIALEEQRYQILVLQKTHSDLTALYTQFCQRYEHQPKQVIVYRIHAQDVLPPDWTELHTTLPIIALGSALWGKRLSNELGDDK
ncbi:type IV pilus biogenesis protein PilM [Pasteurella canis]|uniref:competence protein ComA n=1 Tax=Pasteurella canis TaxID=753 RepID=UPI000D9E7DB6|nr:competence protein ComA [Pasteurella canis]MXN88096.1 competence protein ComA [Pasteurella canis]SPY33850.1 competence protein A [Pasteurella canis]